MNEGAWIKPLLDCRLHNAAPCTENDLLALFMHQVKTVLPCYLEGFSEPQQLRAKQRFIDILMPLRHVAKRFASRIPPDHLPFLLIVPPPYIPAERMERCLIERGGERKDAWEGCNPAATTSEAKPYLAVSVGWTRGHSYLRGDEHPFLALYYPGIFTEDASTHLGCRCDQRVSYEQLR